MKLNVNDKIALISVLDEMVGLRLGVDHTLPDDIADDVESHTDMDSLNYSSVDELFIELRDKLVDNLIK